jgi:hypothetical protein
MIGEPIVQGPDEAGRVIITVAFHDLAGGVAIALRGWPDADEIAWARRHAVAWAAAAERERRARAN